MIKHSKPTIDASEIKRISDVLISGDHATKETVGGFEKRLSSFIGVRDGVAANSGTSALHIALLSLGIKSSDEVIMPSFVCTALLNAVNYIGVKPVLTDIDEGTFNISYRSTCRKITKRTKAVIIPHMFGLPVDIRPFLNLGISIIEDCAQSLGAESDAERVGSQGHVSIFSFYATKLISTGHGGMLTSNSKPILKRARDLLSFDKRNNYKLRFNYNMTDFQAALGISQLARLEKFIKKRREIASYYDRRFKNPLIRSPIEKDNIYYRYVVGINRDVSPVISSFRRYGIEAKRPVFKSLHRYLKLDNKDFPVTEKAFRESLSLPIYPDLKETEKKKVADLLIKILNDRKC